MRIRPKPGDFLIVLLLLLTAVLGPVVLATGAGAEITAIVTQDGEEIARVNLANLPEPLRIAYDGEYPGIILAENGRIRFLEAECPDHVCVDTGWLTRAGGTAACLPARVLVRLEGNDAGDVDVRLQ